VWIAIVVIAAVAVTFVALRRGGGASQEPVPEGLPLDRAVTLLLERNQTLEAVKRVRASHGIGLKDAKDLVDRIRAGESVTTVLQAASNPTTGASRAASADDLDNAARTLMQQGEKIEAIKLVRERTGLGLADAKAFVEGL
jgi:ribosomal protein L7/L12